MTRSFITGTGLLPSPAEAMRYGVSPDDHRKTRNALKAIRKARRNPKPKGLRTDIPRTVVEEVATIRRQLARLDARPADGMDEKDVVRSRLLARLRELGETL